MKQAADVNESALKHYFGKSLLLRMTKSLIVIYPSFDSEAFINLMPRFDTLEMKDRVRLIRSELRRQLPTNYPDALAVLLKSVRSGDLGSFDLWPYTDFIQTYGLDHLEISLEALKEMTPHFTSEWAIRPFLKFYQKKTLSYLKKCARDNNTSVRRWASEGTRPRLPWGERLHEFIKKPSSTVPILEVLKWDSELFVRKSVANHLNDISKDHPLFVIELLQKWKTATKLKDVDKTNWIIRHALRNLIKAGHTKALALIDVKKNAKLKITHFRTSQTKIKMGERLHFEFEVTSLSKNSQKLVVDYIIHFVKSNGHRSPKVFKMKTFELPPKAHLTLSKKHHFKKITTRAYYSGSHCLEIQINGIVVESCEWTLTS